MSPLPTVLVSGAGVAGLATAWWLRHFGFAVTLVEQAPLLRDGGHAVDIRGVALEVTKAMGLHEALQAQRTRLRGLCMLDSQGEPVSHDDSRTFSGGRLDSADIEIFRDTLCRLLANAGGAPADICFDEHITGLTPSSRGVTVSFARQLSRTYDVVIGADGVYSSVRRHAVHAGDDCLLPLGGALSFYSAPGGMALDGREGMYRDAELGVVVYPDAAGRELRIGAGFAADVDAALRHDVAAQKALTRRRLASLAGRWQPLVDALDSTDAFYFGELVQVKLAAWSNGRTVLVGDAAHCASPFSGQGTSLALVGAFVLARELANQPASPEAAFTRYEARMRRFVALNQALVDMTRQGPVPDAQMAAAANGIALPDLRDP
jgi:2-polyprenyl-6-methoxyphenol hydroxylase-like FAD-dependent oxidoreductase